MALPAVKLKNEVKINGAHFYREMTLIIDALRETAPALTDGTVWITSANDGAHMQGSLHYQNKAFDVRVLNIVAGAQEGQAWVERLKVKLGADYDVIWEGDHIHCELDREERRIGVAERRISDDLT